MNATSTTSTGSTGPRAGSAGPRAGSAGNVIAALCSFFIPGLGQLIQGRFLAAAFFFLIVTACYSLAAFGAVLILPLFLYLPGALLHLGAILSCATWRGEPR